MPLEIDRNRMHVFQYGLKKTKKPQTNKQKKLNS